MLLLPTHGFLSFQYKLGHVVEVYCYFYTWFHAFIFQNVVVASLPTSSCAWAGQRKAKPRISATHILSKVLSACRRGDSIYWQSSLAATTRFLPPGMVYVHAMLFWFSSATSTPRWMLPMSQGHKVLPHCSWRRNIYFQRRLSVTS